ncbi:MAG TPA: DUF2852 domain-containing protein [Beijerinckiaceae bacterium]|nr:DUF2852 domain-containing protein [Beijerinckiaceae bacterium]
MSCSASTAGWNTGFDQRRCGPPRKGLEIAGIVLGFIFAWPLALAYVAWKFMGYPVPKEAKEFFDKNFTHLSWNGPFRPRPHFSRTGNFAFEEYRRRELERLEEERRRLDEEAQHFGEFVEELKRAKDREEFDAFMAKRRNEQNGPTDI